jgi:hypothetical protein
MVWVFDLSCRSAEAQGRRSAGAQKLSRTNSLGDNKKLENQISVKIFHKPFG